MAVCTVIEMALKTFHKKLHLLVILMKNSKRVNETIIVL